MSEQSKRMLRGSARAATGLVVIGVSVGVAVVLGTGVIAVPGVERGIVSVEVDTSQNATSSLVCAGAFGELGADPKRPTVAVPGGSTQVVVTGEGATERELEREQPVGSAPLVVDSSARESVAAAERQLVATPTLQGLAASSCAEPAHEQWLVGGATGAFGGVVLGTALTVLAGSVAARARASHGPDSHPPSRRAIRSLLVESGHAMTLLFAFFALSSADVLLARATLDAHDAGLYAAGQILAKSVLFLPSFVSVVAFPRLARGGRRKLHLAGLAVVLGIGLVVVLGTVAFPGLALTLVGGASYAQTGQSLWEFAALGAVLAGIQLLVTTALARRHTRAAWVVWVALAFIAAAGLASDTWTALLHWVLAIDVLLLLALVALTWRDRFTAGELSEQP